MQPPDSAGGRSWERTQEPCPHLLPHFPETWVPKPPLSSPQPQPSALAPDCTLVSRPSLFPQRAFVPAGPSAWWSHGCVFLLLQGSAHIVPVLVHSGCYNKISETEWLEAEESKTKAPAHFLVHRWPSFPCVFTWQKRGESALESLS